MSECGVGNLAIARYPQKKSVFGTRIHTNGQISKPSMHLSASFQGAPKVPLPLSSILQDAESEKKLVIPIRNQLAESEI